MREGDGGIEGEEERGREG
jgi:hypothetical protein